MERKQDTDFCCMCVGIRRKYRREMQKTQRNLFGNPACKLSVHTHTPTHFITHDRFKAQHTRKDQQSVMCTVFETVVTLSSAGCHTLCAPSRGPRAPSCSLRDQAKNRSSLFHFKVTGGQ